MSTQRFLGRSFPRQALVATLVLAISAVTQVASAQFIQRSIGGVSVDVGGLLRNTEVDEFGKLRAEWEKAAQAIPQALNERVELRKISLRRLEEAIAEHRSKGTPLSDEIRYLAGLQRIQYVFVYPEQNDIVLAGPGEGWKLNAQGEVVGLSTNRPVMLLDDLLVALRTAESSRQTGISCSIDPTSEGLTRLQNLVKQLKTIGPNPQATIGAIEETLGPQNITVTGIPGTSHFARVIVAADYKMKRLAMGFEPAPVNGMPSFLQLMKAGPRGLQNMMPRWWLAPDYDALLADPTGLAWELRGAGVKTMSEEDFLTESGERQHTGKASPVAKKWADSMTAHYDELAAKEVVFGQLQNCMDLAIVGALIVKQNLTEKASHSFPLLLNGEQLQIEQYVAPERVDSKASVLKKGRNWIISASGGVQVEAWGLVDKPAATADIAPKREQSASTGNHWWWN